MSTRLFHLNRRTVRYDDSAVWATDLITAVTGRSLPVTHAIYRKYAADVMGGAICRARTGAPFILSFEAALALVAWLPHKYTTDDLRLRADLCLKEARRRIASSHPQPAPQPQPTPQPAPQPAPQQQQQPQQQPQQQQPQQQQQARLGAFIDLFMEANEKGLVGDARGRWCTLLLAAAARA